MIRGVQQAFKFTTRFDFDDISNIVAVFSQTNNLGMDEHIPLPITKYYNKSITRVDEFDENTADKKKVYRVDTKYYRYNPDANPAQFISSGTQPTELDLLGGAIAIYPVENNANIHISKTYKCEKSYYQYDPDEQEWIITLEKPSFEPTVISQPDINILGSVDKKRACVYEQKYYQYDGTSWVPSDVIRPIKEEDYWDLGRTGTNEGDYSRSETYCARETYYKYVDGSWRSYGCNCIEPIVVYAWNDTVEASAKTSEIYVLKEFFYEYNETTDKFEKTAKQEVYYKYLDGSWEEFKDRPNIDVEYVGLWSEVVEPDTNKVYVCKNVYYRYDEDNGWVDSDKMQFSVIEIDKFDDTVYAYDESKIYLCPTRYYQYSITDGEWKEIEEIKEPKIENLSYWTELNDRDKNKVYLCGPTYYQYNSEKAEWQSSSKFNMQIVQIDGTDGNKMVDESKVYKCCPLYYIYKNNAWVEYNKSADIADHNDGFTPVDEDRKSFVVILSGAETNTFSDIYKGRVQVHVYSDKHNSEDKSKLEYFTVYPSTTDEIFSYTPSANIGKMLVFDAGEIV